MHVAIRYGSDGHLLRRAGFGARAMNWNDTSPKGMRPRWKSCFILSRPRQPLMMKT